MTIDQMQHHLKAYTKKNLLEQINKVTLDAIASQGDNKAIKKSITNLQKVIDSIENTE